jgi:hypothetical protein
MILLVVLTVPFAMKLDNGFIPVETNIDEELLSTLAYVSTSMLNEEIALSNVYNITFLADDEDPLIESELDDINIYFDKLKYFIDYTVPFEELLLTENSEEEVYQYTIAFVLDEVEYTINFNIIDGVLSGVMNFSGKTFELSGTYITTQGEETFEIEAFSGSDYMSVKLNTENNGDESKLKLEVQSRISNQIRNKTIEIKDELDEQVVIITEDDNEYKLQKEVTAEYTYKFTYRIGSTEGVLEINETVDEFGNQEYNYTIKENGQEKEITKPKPGGNTNDNGNSGNST